MTHDELLAKIDEPNGEFDAGDPTRHHLLLTQSKALRAVVELHKPIMHYKFQSEEISSVECSHCTYGPLSDYYDYPCPTIQAIEEQLK